MRGRGWIAWALVAAVALGLLGWGVWPREADAAYVTSVASRGSITQELTLVGPVTRDAQSRVEVDSPGVVTAVFVRRGDTVAAGDPIASVDSSPLRLVVLQARASVAQAEAQLDADLTAQRNGADRAAVGASPSSSAPALPAAGQAAGQTPSAPTAAATPAYLTELQTALAGTQTALVAQQVVCTPVFASLQLLRDVGAAVPTLPTPTPTPASPVVAQTVTASATPGAKVHPHPTALPSTLPSSLPSEWPSGHPTLPSGHPTALPSVLPTALPSVLPTALPSGLPTALPSGLTLDPVAFLGQFQACATSMAVTAQAEAQAGAAILAASQAMASANQQAAAALAQAQAELQVAAQRASEEAVRQAQAQIEAQLQALAGGTVTDATIARDRATLLDARQRLENAESDLAAATVTSPISGTVGALDFVVGESSAGRSATVVGAGAARVTVDVPLAVRALVSPGTRATLGQLASARTLTGQVVTVSVLESVSVGAPVYPADVLADDPEGTLHAGSYAEVTLLLRTASDVLTVPVSALTKVTDTTGTLEVVDRARSTEASTVTVVTGSVGDGRVEIVSGLSEGQIVVLADRRLPVPGGLGQYQSIRVSASPTPTR